MMKPSSAMTLLPVSRLKDVRLLRGQSQIKYLKSRGCEIQKHTVKSDNRLDNAEQLSISNIRPNKLLSIYPNSADQYVKQVNANRTNNRVN